MDTRLVETADAGHYKNLRYGLMIRQLNKIRAKQEKQHESYVELNSPGNIKKISEVQALKGKHFDAGCTCRVGLRSRTGGVQIQSDLRGEA